ncbi:MAG: hypothetical protein QW112_01190 [Candidatus Micrarchaeia archaeon]
MEQYMARSNKFGGETLRRYIQLKISSIEPKLERRMSPYGKQLLANYMSDRVMIDVPAYMRTRERFRSDETKRMIFETVNRTLSKFMEGNLSVMEQSRYTVVNGKTYLWKVTIVVEDGCAREWGNEMMLVPEGHA